MEGKTLLNLTDEFRIKADALIQNALACKKSPETTLAWRSLQMAKSWLGKLKGELGSDTPYAVVSQVKDIPPTAEVYQGELQVSSGGHLADVNLMRQKIQELHDEISTNTNFNGRVTACIAFQHLAGARFWYGFELQNLRENANKETANV